jgi:N-acetyl-alpha-D-glucosaminyl L-malate synthase BshA
LKIGISCYPTMGGSGVVATELAMVLAAAGDEVHVISYAMPPRLELVDPRLSFHEVVVPHYPLFDYPPYSLALATKMVEVATYQELDLLHVHYAVPNAVSAILARDIVGDGGFKVVTTLHGTDITLVGNDPNYLATTRYGIERSDAVTTVSQSLRRDTVEQLGVTRPIEVIPNFIEPERYEAARRRPGARRWAQGDEVLLVHVSNYRPVKRVHDVVQIFERVARKLDTRLLLVGDGPERAHIEQYCREQGSCDRILFAGSTTSIEEVLVGADLFLLPSETESFGLAALEAMSCEVPVIATDVGGLPEVVEDGVTGFLRPVGDVDAMADAALSLLENRDRLRQFGEAARRQAVERFSEAAVVERYRELYRRVASGA